MFSWKYTIMVTSLNGHLGRPLRVVKRTCIKTSKYNRLVPSHTHALAFIVKHGRQVQAATNTYFSTQLQYEQLGQLNREINRNLNRNYATQHELQRGSD